MTQTATSELEQIAEHAPIKERMAAEMRRVQDEICEAVAALDTISFDEDGWTRDGSRGRSRILQNGVTFEKAAVNTSSVDRTVSSDIIPIASGRQRIEQVERQMQMFATGLSLIIHPHNPMAPTVHANFRYFELDDGGWWFGCGIDLTPSYLFEEDAVYFHGQLKAVCDRYDPTFYPRFKQRADDYFLIRHRGERRGIGGISCAYLSDRPVEEAFAFITDCADTFLPAYLPLLERRKDMPFTAEHKNWQSVRRGRYVEFNLVYDQGTIFGLKADTRPESILTSLPLTARWEYDDRPAPGSHEARTLDVLQHPRAWV
jgi:coproporphyrinogen III oxidase